MKKFLLTAASLALLSNPALAENIGVSMAAFDDNFLTVLRNGMGDHAKELGNVTLQVEDAQNDVGKQQNQVDNFIASGVDAIIVNPVDTDATAALSAAASAAGIPMVYVNRQPANVDSLPEKQAFVGSLEHDAGRMQGEEICKQLKAAGRTEAKAAILLGELSNQASRERTQGFKDVIAGDDCKFITVAEEQTANWQRTQATDLVTNWMSAGTAFDAIASNNDEMAIGAIQALKSASKDLASIVVGGVDATQDGLAALQSGDLDATVFQDAKGQGAGALDTALKIAKGETVESKVYIPFQLVTKDNLGDFISKN
ncbi:MAG TPA: sugar ABC transporter substrate-binding protein [Paracoccus sp. (in: a-proteobacteria)]|uniref:sugar ABC transporter substrate-binding protein n=1 Tax=Paracoccus sp. TaxID=267 RepID=UPI002D1681E1|nr:sugar ABC transporter substrate-binding protein [Paracoccus sp. (in: a-proteobacteria)]HWL56979.1 sugar ABC transporter substrate-binding protein [Paracoccus sp. (in: a-proteobacteria)]